MQQLLEDRETLPFKQGKSINLLVLKKEINRRIVKIRSMLGQNQASFQNDKYAQYASQTQNLQIDFQPPIAEKQRKALSPQKSTIILPVQCNQKTGKYAGRCSLPIRKANAKAADENKLRKSNKVRVAQYLQTANPDSNTFGKEVKVSARNGMPKEVSLNRLSCGNEVRVKATQPDLCNSFQNSKKKGELFTEGVYTPVNIPLVFENPDENFCLVEFDSQDQNPHYIKADSTARKALSLKKYKITQRTALQQERRILVSDDTIQKMSNEVGRLVVKKRREAQDNKLRENIFRKIEEKYGEYFDNI